MKQWMLSLLAVLFSATPVAAQQPPTQRVAPQPGEIPQNVAYDKDGLLGDHIHIFGNTAVQGKCDNSISSMVFRRGHCEFFDDDNFKGMKMGELGLSVYLRVQDHGLKDNSISSIRLVSPMGR